MYIFTIRKCICYVIHINTYSSTLCTIIFSTYFRKHDQELQLLSQLGINLVDKPKIHSTKMVASNGEKTSIDTRATFDLGKKSE